MLESRERPPAQKSEVEAVQLFVPFLLKYLKQELEDLLHSTEQDTACSVQISLLLLAHALPGVAELLLKSPKAVLGYLNNALLACQHHLLNTRSGQDNMCIKELVKARLTGVPCGGGMSPLIGNIRAAHAGCLVVVTGTVTRAGAVQMLEAQRMYECTRCLHQFAVDADMEAGATLQVPAVCPNGRTKPCKSTSFRHMTELQRHSDYQELRIQERSQSLAMGSLPRSITVILLDDLADRCQPGDDVEITGIVTQQWRSCFPGARCDVELVLLANNLETANVKHASFEVSPEAASGFERFWHEHRQCPMTGRNRILASLCPQIYGLFFVKLSTLLMLIGGLQRMDDSGTSIRGEVHMLIVGDPGTGKSQFLKYAAKLSPRAVLTSGKGSSAAGLTATAVKDGPNWALEAGAMVLADGGLCCIDEFDGLKEASRAAIHEAMEQQTVSVAKAGLMATLNTRTTVFGVTNPKGTYDPRESLSVNTTLSAPLLSRFDIVLVLRDMQNPAWDEMVAGHILDCEPAAEAAHPSQGKEAGAGWDLAMLQMYLAWAKGFRPQMTPEAESILLRYYQLQRKSGDRVAARTTIRMLESLVRLAQAHARLMAKGEVTKEDAVVAVALVDASMIDSTLLGSSNMLHLPFPEDPEAEYLAMERRLLSILQAEEEALSLACSVD